MSSVTRPEDPSLDQSQIHDLEEFLSGRSPDQLKRDLKQLEKDVEKDRGPYSSGGTPANVTRAYIALKQAIERAGTKKK